MKQILLFSIAFFTSITLLGQVKKIAMLESLAVTDGISVMVKNMVRGELTKSLSKESGFKAFTRVDIDNMMKEFKFQESGMVNDEQRLKLGQMSGADYVCVSKITKDGNAYYLEAYLIHLESGEINNPASAFVEGGYAFVNTACQKIAAEMVGKKVNVSSTRPSRPAGGQTTKTTSPARPKFQTFSVSVDFKSYKIMVIDRDFTNKMTKGEAVRASKNLSYGGYSDWRLPTKEEIKVIHQHRYELTGLKKENYWFNKGSGIWMLHFRKYASHLSSTKEGAWYDGYDYTAYVRCVRTVN
ncbi:CsgG/HfaB family protein [Marinifilum flexuosum]|uniref:Peptidoglycan-synthase activator LpoB n=1 Tax=Marinifilum flexuosum TaxID=1117708 RepID=A0A419X6R1_9BACT|nr:CsgG/HfaB family protein [Marinifilum flexuosum]RKE03421.1 peptidoglycan-synthase activator LpoB [Marinifilum flexuosum]